MNIILAFQKKFNTFIFYFVFPRKIFNILLSDGEYRILYCTPAIKKSSETFLK
jgi:hypothetical protein